jgi:hypothetical protein
VRAGRFRRLAVLETATASDTPFGGRSLAWTTSAELWVRLVEQGGDPPTASAEARVHPEAVAGARLVLDGERWNVLAARRDAPAPGLMTLDLERAPK